MAKPGHEDRKSGHNSQLQTIVERIENLEAQKKDIGDDIKDVYAEAKSNGFDVATLREVIKIRAQDPEKREAKVNLLDIYMQELGMTPLEEAIANRQKDQEGRNAGAAA